MEVNWFRLYIYSRLAVLTQNLPDIMNNGGAIDWPAWPRIFLMIPAQ
jgi:hypothetical protein